MCRRLSPLLTVLTLVLAACEPGIVEVVHRGEGDGVTRTGLQVRAVVDPADSALGDSLGWGGGIPGVRVHVLRNGTAEWLLQETDSTGTVVFDGLLRGRYRVWGERVLTVQEAQALGGVVRAFGDGRTLDVGGGTTLELHMYADRPGSLVVSEVGIGTGGVSAYGQTYVEVYNNSDSTLFLDGVILGHTYRWAYSDQPDPAAPTSCANTATIRNDPNGLYADNMLAFPGGGSDYSIGPGKTRVVAMSAIDHRAVDPSLLDLSGADFEIGCASCGDNPAVPNMIDVGTQEYVLQGWIPSWFAERVTFLSAPKDVAGLPIVYRDHHGGGYVYIPKQDLFDVIMVKSIWPDLNLEFPPCMPVLHRGMNRYEGPFFEIGFDADPMADATRGVYRRVLRVEAGRVILYNTHTTAVDLREGERTPGGLPPVP